MPAQHLDSSNFKSTVEEAQTPVFVDFYAEWCGPCQMAAPVVDKLAEEYEGKVLITKVNVDEARDIAGEYGVMSIPTAVIIKNGEEVNRQIGFPGEAGFKAMLDEALTE